MMKKLNLNSVRKNYLITFGMVIIAFFITQILLSLGALSSLTKGLLVPICVYIILAVSLNLTVGVLGELSLGHAGFMCIGAFSSAFFSKLTVDTITAAPVRFFFAIVIGALFSALFGIIICIPVLRLKGDYLAIVTLAFGEIIKNIMNVLYVGVDNNGFHFSTTSVMELNMEETGEVIIKGPQGITGTPNDSTFTIGIILILITLVIVLNIIHSRSGRAIMAIRDNRIAAESIGVNITKFKLITFAVSASLAGVAGALYAHNLSSLTATPKNFGYNMSIMILVFVVLGGMGNIKGSIIAALVLTVLPEYLRFMQDYRMLIYAVVLIVMMLFNWSPGILDWRERHSLKNILSKKKKEV